MHHRRVQLLGRDRAPSRRHRLHFGAHARELLGEIVQIGRHRTAGGERLGGHVEEFGGARAAIGGDQRQKRRQRGQQHLHLQHQSVHDFLL